MSQQKAQYGVFKDVMTAIAVCVLIFGITLFLPLLGFFIALVLPMPIVYYRLKLGRNIGIGITLGALAIITAALGGVTIDMLFYGCLFLTGLFLGETIEGHMGPGKTVLTTCLATFASGIVLFLFVAMAKGQGPLTLINAYVEANIAMTLELYSGIGVSEDTIDIITSAKDKIQYAMVRILPSMLIALLMLVTWVNLLFINKVLNKKGLHLKQFQQLNCWRAPEKLVWLVIASTLLLFMPDHLFTLAGLNILIAVLPVYFFQGMGIVSFFFQKKRFPMALKFFIYGMIAIQQFFLLIVIGLGFFDTWFNFRKIDLNDNQTSE